MKILLLNDNPVVNKLVTLSAQKTSDEVDTASHIEEIPSHKYDLLIVDDSVYNDDLFDALRAKIEYKKSLFICNKDAEEVESFSSVLKKPFLPTDLVELFMEFEKEIAKETDEKVEDEFVLNDEFNLDDELMLDDAAENFSESILDDEEAQKVKDLLDENESDLSFDDEVENELESLELEEIGANDEDVSEDEEVLQNDSAEDDLLADYDMALDLEDEADVNSADEERFDLEDEVESLENEELEELDTATVEELEDEIDESVTDELSAKEGDLAFDTALDLEDEADVDIANDVVSELNPEEESEEIQEENPEDIEEANPEEIEEESEKIQEEESEEIGEEIPKEILEEVEDTEIPQEIPEDILEESEDLENKIQSAVEDLTQEDLESELDEDTLLQIATNEIDPLANLTSKDLKEALGEEVSDDEEDVDTPAVSEIEDTIVNEKEIDKTEEDANQNSGVESLKKLLKALSDKDVAASMKGMKISINITLGDER